MARTKGSNKSQSIRDFLGATPTASAKEVVEALAKNGVKVSEGLVYSVKGGMKEKKKRKARVVKAAKAASSTGTATDPITLIREVRALSEKAGGYAKLKELVDALSQ